jgi:carboxyl-terminal processing protease
MVNLSSRSGTTSFRGLRRAGVTALLLVTTRLPAQVPRPTMPDSVRGYIRDAMAAFRAHSIHRAEVDWPTLEDSVVAQSAGAQSPSDTWRALTWALRSVDRHSYLLPPPDKMAALTGGMMPSAPQPGRRLAAAFAPGGPSDGLLDGRIGVVVVPPHSGHNRPAYVDSLQARIGALDGAGACGWVMDLRENTGGNMWPMLAGVGPLLGAEVVGSFTNSPLGVGWNYRDGRSWQGDSTRPAEVGGWGSTSPRLIKNPTAPVALLVGRKTASSGEMTLLAFLGRPHVRSFGDSTAGYTSSNTTVPLRDGATLIVTSSYPRDRLGRTYPLSVGPDELVPPTDSAESDAPLRRAVAWLRQQPACAERR